MRKTIRVLFANCPRLDDAACAYLLLAQNKIQTVFQFEVHHLFVEFSKDGHASDRLTDALESCATLPRWAPFRRAADRRYRARLERQLWPVLKKTLPIDSCIETLRPYVEKHDRWLRNLSVGYGNWTMEPGPMIVLTETQLGGGYLSSVSSDIAIVNLGDWRKYAPPSTVEYVLFQVQRAALRMALNPRIGSHYPTRGCVWDFAAHQPDARLCVVGTLCDACWQLVRELVTPEEKNGLELLLSHEWLGETEEPGTVASTLKRVFGFDLALTRGLSPSFFQRFREGLPSGIVTLLVGAIGGIASILFTAWLRHKGLIR